MYTEFIIGYVLMGILLVLLAVVIVLLCIILKKLSNKVSGHTKQYGKYNNSVTGYGTYTGNGGTVICRNCATQYDAVHSVCPRCGTPR